jgi:hypothetical protein
LATCKETLPFGSLPRLTLALRFTRSSSQFTNPTVEVKLLGHGEEVYVLAKSQGRRAKEIAVRRRKLTKPLRNLRTLRRTRQ